MQEEYMDYYAKFDEEKRLLSQNITRIEFDTTINVLGSYLESAGRLICSSQTGHLAKRHFAFQ
ncbi:hypothetical protein AB6C54_06765, partial [Vibrio splendidus]